MPSNGHQNYDQFAWARSLQSTMPELLREVEDTAKKNYQIMALLEAGGRITTGHGGAGIKWQVKYRNHKAEGATGENSRNFTPTNLWKSANLGYRGYEVTDSIKRREMEQNKGDAAVISVLDGFGERLKESIVQELAPQFYINGEDPENEMFWHGFRTYCQSSGQTVNIDGTGPRAKNAADKVAAPAGTYAGLDTALGAYGGAQHDTSLPWPEGTQDPQYDFWSATQVVRDSSAFSGTGGEKLEKALRYGITHAQRNSTLDGQITNIFLDRSLYIDLKDFNDGRQTIEVKQAPGSLVELGFRNVMIFDGVEVGYENAVPSGYGFGLNIACMELMGLTQSLFEDEGGPQYDMKTQSLNAVVSTLSNIKYKSPRNFCVWKPLSEV